MTCFVCGGVEYPRGIKCPVCDGKPIDVTAVNLRHALYTFQQATLALSIAWESVSGDAIGDYPDYLPSFDEFAHDVQAMYVKPDKEVTP